MIYHRLIKPVIAFRPMLSAACLGGFLLCLILALSQSVWASSDNSSSSDERIDLSELDVLPDELALTQVFSEICPPMLNSSQKRRFTRAYHAQLKEFMPSLNPTEVMRQINGQKEYKKTLKRMRAWTLTFPKEENRALCVEFSEASF